MNDTKKRQVLKLASLAGELLMKYGAEVFRVEDTVRRICRACRVDNVDVFVVPTGLFLSIEPDSEDGEVLSSIRRLKRQGTDVKKIMAINHFSREFATTDLSVEEGIAQLMDIDDQPGESQILRLLGAGVTSAAFGTIYSGNALTALFTFVIGFFCQWIYDSLGKLKTNFFIKGMIACAVATTLGLVLNQLAIPMVVGATIIGAIMLFAPGATLTNSIRDLLSGDFLSGLTRLAETVLIALSLATGVGIMMKLYDFLAGEGAIGGVTSPRFSVLDSGLPLWLILLLGAVSVLGYSSIYHLPGRIIIPAFLTGGIGWTAYQILFHMGQSMGTAIFAGAFLVGGFSRVCSKIWKAPTSAFIIPSIIPLVPGSLTYYCMQAFFQGDVESGLALGLDTFTAAGAIALGLLAVGAAVQLVHQIHHRNKTGGSTGEKMVH